MFSDKYWYHLHVHNAQPRTSQASVDYIDRHKFVRVHHPPYSPDLAPTDFYLFEYMKGKLALCHGTTKEEFFGSVTEILDSIPEEELVQVFLNSTTRLEQVISTDGEEIKVPKLYIQFH
jgi:hypothetical protein